MHLSSIFIKILAKFFIFVCDAPFFFAGKKKVPATRAVCNGPYAEIEELLIEYEQEHFSNLAGARRAIKDETNEKYKKKKLSSLRRILHWLSDKTKMTDITDLLSNVKKLGEIPGGYFAENRKTTVISG